MKSRPILFNGPMVRALLSGSKTQTRRIVKGHALAFIAAEKMPILMSPYGQPSDQLWVREAYADIGCRLTYRADTDDGAHCMVNRWTPSIHMPRSDSRISLEIAGIRVERLQDISEADALAEGIAQRSVIVDAAYEGGGHVEKTADRYLHGKWPCDVFESAGEAYADLWESINGPGSWAANPWVWVISFKRVPA